VGCCRKELEVGELVVNYGEKESERTCKKAGDGAPTSRLPTWIVDV
jgi:hypothetical protein